MKTLKTMKTFPKIIRQDVADGAFITFTHEGGGRYTFSSTDGQLQAWIDDRRTQRVSFDEIHFVVEAAASFVRTGVAEGRGRSTPYGEQPANPVQALNERCQQVWRRSMAVSAPVLEGAAHCPTVSVIITLPDGQAFEGKASNQREARVAAATRALRSVYVNARKY